MRNHDMAAMLVPRLEQAAQSSNIGWHTGVIRTWDELTGLNTVDIAGTEFTNVLVLSTGAPQAYVPGDVVIVLRLNTQYFIFGKVRAPGYGAGERIAADRVADLAEVTSSSYDDINGSPGPETTLYVGSGRRVLVVHSCEIHIYGDVGIGDQGTLHQAVQITGASNIAPATGVTNAFLKAISGTSVSASATTLVTAAEGLQQGQNTFTCKYQFAADAGQQGQVNNRVLTVIPF